MTDKFKNFLQSLSPAEADQLWDFFDGDPDAIMKVIDVLMPIARNEGAL